MSSIWGRGLRSLARVGLVQKQHAGKGKFVGGCDSVREMLEAGELTSMLDAKGVVYDKSKLTA